MISLLRCLALLTLLALPGTTSADFTLRSTKDGKWSDPQTWSPARVPTKGDRVLVSSKNRVVYDVDSPAVIRYLQVAGTLTFARNRDTTLNVGILTIHANDQYSETGFDCHGHVPEFKHAEADGQRAALEVGTLADPIPADVTARIRLHFIDGMDAKDGPVIVCCGGRMDIHGAPMSRTWMKLGKTAKPGDSTITLREPVTGWRKGDRIIVTGSERGGGSRFRNRPETVTTEERTITAIEGDTITLDEPLAETHFGEGDFRSEAANLSRNVIVESADPDGVRGHTMYHRHSAGSLSYAQFAHLGKEAELGRYPIHYHLVGSTMRGSSVIGVSVVDSHNRWVTVHGTHFLVVRDCVGYQSVGHGFFLEDAMEMYNLLDRNLGVQAYRGKRMKDQALPFDPNDGAAFWWANGRNSLTRNVACENEEYGFRYDCQMTRSFDCTLPILQPDGKFEPADVRKIGIWRFDGNESHTEGFYGFVIAANGNSQPDVPVRDQRAIDRLKQIDWTGPDTTDPHRVKNFITWRSHYAFRPHSPSMRAENVRIHNTAYGIYRPAFQDHEYVNLHISNVGAEPFNRGMDDASVQLGVITVDGLTFETGYGNSNTPLVQISDNAFGEGAATHFRNITVNRPEQFRDRWPLFNRGVGPRVEPVMAGVPIYVHDHYGPGRHAKVVATSAKDLLDDGNEYRSEPPVTGSQARVTEVTDIEWPTLLDLTDTLPPATIVLSVHQNKDGLMVRGVSHDNGTITKIRVNERNASIVSSEAGVVDWEIQLPKPDDGKITAFAIDEAGNVETFSHMVMVPTHRN